MLLSTSPQYHEKQNKQGEGGWEEAELLIISAPKLLIRIYRNAFKNTTKASKGWFILYTIKRDFRNCLDSFLSLSFFLSLPLSVSLSLISNLLPSALLGCKSERRLTCSPKLYLLTFSNV